MDFHLPQEYKLNLTSSDALVTVLNHVITFFKKSGFSVLLFFLFSRFLYLLCYLILNQKGMLNASLLDNVCHFDCEWYRSIIYHGYDLNVRVGSDQANWAFFPLFPLVSQFFLFLFHSEISILIFNQVLFLGSMALLYQYCESYYSKKVALMATFLLSVSSENMYIGSLYTESLFIFLSLLSVYLISKQKYIQAAFVCCLLSATRIQGFLMVFPLLFSLLRGGVLKRNKYNFLFISLLSVSGLLMYMIYLHVHVHDFLAFYHIQSAWGRNTHSWLHPLTVLMTLRGRLNDVVLAILSVPVMHYFYKNRKYNEVIFFSLCFLMVISSQNLRSYTRFIMANYAFYIFLAIFSIQNWRRLLCMTAFMLICTLRCTYVWLAIPEKALC